MRLTAHKTEGRFVLRLQPVASELGEQGSVTRGLVSLRKNPGGPRLASSQGPFFFLEDFSSFSSFSFWLGEAELKSSIAISSSCIYGTLPLGR